MNAKEFLRQAYRLNQRIDSDIAEAADLRRLASSVSSPSLEFHNNPNHPTEAPFVRCLEKVWALEEKINAEIDKLIELREQIRQAIEEVDDSNEQLVLRYRYLQNYKWEQIGDILYADESTIRRWHRAALQHVKVPEDCIVI